MTLLLCLIQTVYFYVHKNRSLNNYYRKLLLRDFQMWSAFSFTFNIDGNIKNFSISYFIKEKKIVSIYNTGCPTKHTV